MVYGCDPLRIYIFKEGLARFATEEYKAPTNSNIGDMFIHLTNYAINKNNDNYMFNESADNADIGHKRSLQSIWKYIDEHGDDSKNLRLKIREIIVKTLCAVQPQLAESYKSCQPSDNDNDKCFEILGFDILINHKLKPLLLEVNHTPSFSIDTPFDAKVKSNLLTDTIILLHMDSMKRINYYRQKEIDAQNRCLGKSKGFKRYTKEERKIIKEENMEKRDKYELENCGGFTRIYPDLDDPNKYEIYIEKARQIWDKFYGLKRKQKKSIPESPPKINNRITINSTQNKKSKDEKFLKRLNTNNHFNRINSISTERMGIPQQYTSDPIQETLLCSNNERLNELSKPKFNNQIHLPSINRMKPIFKRIPSKGFLFITYRTIGSFSK